MAPGKFHLHIIDKGSGFLRSKVQKLTRLQRYNTLMLPTLLYGTNTWTLKDQQKSRITADEMKFLRKTAKYTLFAHKRNDSICKEHKIHPVLEQINNYNSKWIQHVHQVARSRLMQAIMKYQLAWKRNPGCPLKRLMDFDIQTRMDNKVLVLETMMMMMMVSQHSGFYGILILWLLWPVFKVLDQSSGSGHMDKMATVPFVKISENFHSCAWPNPKSLSRNSIWLPVPLCTFTAYLPFVKSSDFHLFYLNRTQIENEQNGQIHSFH